MRYLLLAFAFAAALIPAAAAAQTPPPGGPIGGPPGGGPPPGGRMEQFRATAKVNALKALSPDHQAKVQAIASSVGSGSLTMRDGAKEINALLTPDESKAIDDQQQKLFALIQAARGGGNPPAPPPSGAPQPPSQDQGARPREGQRPDAGRFLLRLLIPAQEMRALRDQQPKPQ